MFSIGQEISKLLQTKRNQDLITKMVTILPCLMFMSHGDKTIGQQPGVLITMCRTDRLKEPWIPKSSFARFLTASTSLLKAVQVSQDNLAMTRSVKLLLQDSSTMLAARIRLKALGRSLTTNRFTSTHPLLCSTEILNGSYTTSL